MRKIESRSPGGAPGSIDGRYVVVQFGVAVQREPVAHERKPVGEVERREARAGIVRAVLYRCGGRVGAEETFEKSVNCNWRVPFTTPDHSTLEAELEVFRGPEIDFLHVHPRVAGA